MEKTTNGAHEVIVVEDGEETVELPGFRFHPTDEELVRFYLRRKVNKKAFSLDIIKDIDIYKYDPWDLPKVIGAGEKEWYFFCPRGRKYKNSIRPNRVTGAGFWKATGIDRTIYSGSSSGDCIGLKKSLVYYRGRAGKGTKTDWMMHEFRLPSSINNAADNTSPGMQEAHEIWTICRIFRRNVSYKKDPGKWKDSTNRTAAVLPAESSSKAVSSFELDSSNLTPCCTSNIPDHGHMPKHDQSYYDQESNNLQSWPAAGQLWNSDQYSSVTTQGTTPSTAALHPNAVASPDINDLFTSDGNYDWDEIGRMVDLMTDHGSVTSGYLYV